MVKYKTLAAGCAILVIGLLILSACSPTSASTRIRATWINPTIQGESVSIPASEVEKDTIAHFKVTTPADDLAFMAYQFDGKLYARANICPPCLSEGFSLVGNTLVCDTCGTVFDAKTGAGIKGACIAYPKAAVPYEVKDGNITMKGTDLAAAFQNTLKPKK